MDEFVYVLLAGLALIVVAIFVWGGDVDNGDDILNNTSVIAPFSIGAFPQDVPRSVRLGDFKVSYAVGSDDLKTDKNVQIKKGIFSEDYHTMSVEIDTDLDSVTSGNIKINVLDTNSAGNLIVEVNDVEVWNQKTGRGPVDINVDKDVLEEYNVIEIRTSHSGWEFWKTSLYELEKVEFELSFWGNTKKVEDFIIYQDELENFRSGTVMFDVENIKGMGDLIIEINGREIYRSEPDFNEAVEFDDLEVGLRKGVNTISFSAESGVEYEIDDAEVIIIHEEIGIKKRSFDFYVSVGEYNKLEDREGRIKFKITNTNYEGNLRITITDPDGEVHSPGTVQSYSIGETITLRFNQDHVEPGTNELNFEVTNDGNFVISNVEIDFP